MWMFVFCCFYPLPPKHPHFPFSLFSPCQGTMLQAIERYMKQAIVDKVPGVSSSALVSSFVSKAEEFCKSGVLSGWEAESAVFALVFPLRCFFISLENKKKTFPFSLPIPFLTFEYISHNNF